MRPVPLGIDEDDEDMVVSPSKESFYKDEKSMDNPMHDILLQEHPSIPTLGLEALVEAITLFSIGKSL